MSSLVSIMPANESLGGSAALEAHRISKVPVVVISPHNQCDCRCVMCDIWRIREAREISAADLERQLSSIRELGVRWVVFSGGEPQKNRQLPLLARMLRSQGIRVTILTAGLLLEEQAETIAGEVDDVIVSLDGPARVHNRIRRVADAYERLAAGVKVLHRVRAGMMVQGRCTVQKLNHDRLCDTVTSAREIGLNSISFLAADATSPAFNRPSGWPADRQSKVLLTSLEVNALEAEMERLIAEHGEDLVSGFVVESVGKLRRIVGHFRAALGQTQPVAPRCNAPWVSAVVEAGGDVRPCFFHGVVGNIHGRTLSEIVNGPDALRFRQTLDVASNPICQQCVCSLYIPTEAA